jgi:hypothetical protein
VAVALTLAGGVSAHQKAPTQAAALGIKGRVHVIKVPVFFYIDKVAKLTTKKGSEGCDSVAQHVSRSHQCFNIHIYTNVKYIFKFFLLHIPRVRREQRNDLEISCILIFVGFSWTCERNEAKW